VEVDGRLCLFAFDLRVDDFQDAAPRPYQQSAVHEVDFANAQLKVGFIDPSIEDFETTWLVTRA
jgi:hypothetical protein